MPDFQLVPVEHDPWASAPQSGTQQWQSAIVANAQRQAQAPSMGQQIMDIAGNTGQMLAAPLMAGPRLMGDVMEGRLDPNSPEAIRRSADVALNTAGMGMMGAERGAVGALGGRGIVAPMKDTRFLPSGSSLAVPPAPTAEQMKAFARVESVPLSAARSTQSKMDWSAGERPPELISGYGDKPVAVKKENGEYLIFDGHHRIVNAINEGKPELNMHVIDAKSYAPEFSGRKPAASSMSDDELLRQLEAPQAIVQKRGENNFLVKSPDNPDNRLAMVVEPDAVHVKTVDVRRANRNAGIGISLYEKAIAFAAERGLPLRSDVTVTNDALHVYDALRRRGYDVTETPGTTTSAAGKSNEKHVFEVRGIPQRASGGRGVIRLEPVDHDPFADGS